MATLHEKKVKFNSKLTVSNTGGNLSTDSGLILVKEFMDSLNFSDLSKQHLEIEDKRLYHTHDNFSLMEQLIYQNIAGYSTHSDTYGNQEKTDYNAHYQTNGYRPLVAFDGLTGDFLKAELRSGNVYTSTGIGAFVEPLFEHYNQVVPVSNILVRGDSGFATPELYDLCEVYDSFFVIRLKANRNLSKLAESFIQIDDNHPWDKKEVVYSSTSYQAKSWSKERRVCIKSTREADELLFRHEYIITNYSNNVSAETVFRTYSKRGTMENIIKEAKNGFYFDKTDSPSFL